MRLLMCFLVVIINLFVAIHFAGPLTVYLSSGVIDTGLVIESTALNA